MPLTSYDPRTQSLAGKLPVRTGDFAEAAFAQGVNDTLLGWASRQAENFDLGDTGDEIAPDELKSRYGLTFTQPMREGRAQLLAARKQAEDDRAFVLGNGLNGFGRFSLMMGAGMAGSLANPVDFAANLFIPFVGEAAAPVRAGLEAAEATTLIGKTAARAKRFVSGGGLITTSELRAAGLPSGPVMASIFEGAMANAAIEIPLAYEKIVQEHNDHYGLGDSVLNVAAGGVLAGGIRAAGKAVGAALSRLSASTHEAALREALNAAALGIEPDAMRTIRMSDEQIRAEVMERALARADKEMGVFLDESARAEFEAKNPKGVGAAAKPERMPAGSLDLLYSAHAEAQRGTVLGKILARQLDRFIAGERGAEIFHNIASLLGQRYEPGRVAVQAEQKSAAVFAASNEAKKIAKDVRREIFQLEAAIRENAKLSEAAKDPLTKTTLERNLGELLRQRSELADRLPSVEKDVRALSDLTPEEVDAHTKEMASGRLQPPSNRTEVEVETRSRLDAEFSRKLQADFEAEKKRRVKQYFDELLPTTPEARAKFVDRHAQQRSIELDETAKKAGVSTDAELKKYAEASTLDKVGSVVDEDIAALKAGLTPEQAEAIKVELGSAAVKPNYEKGFKSVIDCIGKTL